LINLSRRRPKIAALSAAITAALDGGKKAMAERNPQKNVVMKSLLLLDHYIEANCKDDIADVPIEWFPGIECVT
jgi:hypothetical protein